MVKEFRKNKSHLAQSVSLPKASDLSVPPQAVIGRIQNENDDYQMMSPQRQEPKSPLGGNNLLTRSMNGSFRSINHQDAQQI
jgi:hypothetical protein